MLLYPPPSHRNGPDVIARLGPNGLESPPVERPADAWPREVEMILTAMDAALPMHVDPEARAAVRITHRVPAALALFSDPAGRAPWRLYTRDASPRGVGFITPHRLPLGYGGTVELAAPAGHVVRAACTLFRCREATRGWFEGALYFNREQADFAAT